MKTATQLNNQLILSSQKFNAIMKKLVFNSNTITFRLIVLFVSILAFTACERKEEQAFSEAIRNNVPEETIEKIRQMGITVNEGTKPPVLEGAFWLSPQVMTHTDVPDDKAVVGQRFVDYKISMHDQDNKNLTIMVDTKGYNFDGTEVSSTIGKDGAYVSGNGKNFTVFIISEGKFTYNTSRYKNLAVYSGEMTSTGIRNLQWALLMMDNYGNVNKDLIPNNTGRAFKDEDGISELLNSMRLAASRTGINNIIAPLITPEQIGKK